MYPSDSEHTSFDFPLYTFRGRFVRGRRGFFVSFTPAISTKALQAKGLQIRAWHLNRLSGTDLSGLAEAINPGSARLDQLLRALLPLDVVLPCPAHRRAPRTVGHAEVQTTARQPNPSAEMAARRAAAAALALRSLVPPRITAGPDCGSRMTRDCHVRFSREREGEVPSRYPSGHLATKAQVGPRQNPNRNGQIYLQSSPLTVLGHCSHKQRNHSPLDE